MHRRQFAASGLILLALAGTGGFAAAAGSQESDGLVKVKSKRLKAVYLRPGADFRPYHKVMIDPTQVAMRKNWARDFNSSQRGLSTRVSEKDVQAAVEGAAVAATAIFAKAFTDGGYAVVTTPAPDVLRVRTGLVDISVSAPDLPTAGRVDSYTQEAGQATLVVEARDSQSGAVLGRGFDARLAGDRSIMLRRTRGLNRSDFRHLAEDWAKISVRGLNELKTLSPVKS